MKLADKILSKISVEEKVEDTFFTDMEIVFSSLSKSSKNIKNKKASILVKTIMNGLESLINADESGFVSSFEAAIKQLKADKIEEDLSDKDITNQAKQLMDFMSKFDPEIRNEKGEEWIESKGYNDKDIKKIWDMVSSLSN